jgi:predicted alpha/beta-hydrolase family hydrolase
MNPFFDDSTTPAVRGYLYSSQDGQECPPHTNRNSDALILTHGAGSNCNAPLLVAISETFAAHGYTVLRCDLPFRQERKTGPPFPGNAGRDRAGLRNAVAALRKLIAGKIFLGGQSYGGRQASLLCAEEPELVSGLILLSYPLHPPGKPEQLRIQHLPNLRAPCLFVQGTRDPFGSVEEIEKALALIPATHELMKVEGAGHDLGWKGKGRIAELPARIMSAFQQLRASVESRKKA